MARPPRGRPRRPSKRRDDLTEIFEAPAPTRPTPKAKPQKPAPKAPAVDPVFTLSDRFEILAICAPGQESALCDELTQQGFANPTAIAGGATVMGGWADVWRANLNLRGAARILARLGSFPAAHLAQLDKRAHRVPWADILPQGAQVRVEASCHKSKIYHQKAAAQRVETALKDCIGAQIDPEAALCIKLRIDQDICTLSIDTSGEALHKRGIKQAVGKAPMRENMAALILRSCGYTAGEALYDPMCGSGTFVLEAAEISAGLQPGRARRFAFEGVRGFDANAFAALRASAPAGDRPAPVFFGSDRDGGAIKSSHANADRAGVADLCQFTCASVSDIVAPDVPPGLVVINPPYGMRIGERRPLFALYGTMGRVLRERFRGWRVGLVCPDAGLIRAMELPFLPQPQQIMHGGIRLGLYQTKPL